MLGFRGREYFKTIRRDALPGRLYINNNEKSKKNNHPR